MAEQNFQVNYDINVKTTGVEDLSKFSEAVKSISLAQPGMKTAAEGIENTMKAIDSMFKKYNKGTKGKGNQLNYSFKIDTKGSEERLLSISKLLDDVITKSKNVKLNIAAGKPLNAAQVKKNAKNISDQNKEIARLAGVPDKTVAQDITKRIGKINAALTHLERGREVNIKTETAKARLQELLGLLGQVRRGTTGMHIGITGNAPSNAVRAPFAPRGIRTYALPQEAQDKLNQRLITNQALQQQRLVHANQNAAAKIRQQTQMDATRQQTKNMQQAARQQEAEAKRQATVQAKLAADQARVQQRQNAQILRGYMKMQSSQEGLYSRTRQGAINRLQYSKPPSLRTAIPFGYMLNGYMLFNTMKKETQKAVEYANIMESARSILKVADTDLGTFQTRFDQMADNVRRVGVETKFTAVEVAGAVKYLAMAGQDIDSINKSIRPIANLALIGDNDISQIADLTTNIMAGYNIDPNSMNSVADIIASTISRSNVNIIETAESFKMAAGTLRMAGIDFTEASAAIGILGNAGMKGTLSGTSLRNIALRLAAPTDAAKDALSRMGINYKVKENVYGKQVERFRPLADIFQDLNKAGATIEDLKVIFGTRGANGAMMLLSNHERLRELTAANRTSQGVSDQLAQVKQETTKGLWYQMTSRFSETFMEGYESMEPQIQSVLRGFLEKFKSEDFSKGLATLGGALMDLLRLLGNIATWFASNFNWLGPTIFSGLVATKIYKLAGAVTNLGVALGILGKKQAAMSGIQLLSQLTGTGGFRLGKLSFGDKRKLVTTMREMGIAGKGAMTQVLRSGNVTGVRSAIGRTGASVFATQVATGRGVVGATASLGAMGTGAIVAAGAFGVLAAAIGAVAYKTWKMHETHRAVIEDLEKKEEYSFPSLDALYTSLNKAYTAAKDTKSALDDLTRDKNFIEQTGQPMGIFSKRGWMATMNAFAASAGYNPHWQPYTHADAYQDNINEGLHTLFRQESVATREKFFAALGKRTDPVEVMALVNNIPKDYGQDLTKIDSSLYVSRMVNGEQVLAYDPQTGEGTFVRGLKKDMTVEQGLHTGTFMRHVNDSLVPQLQMYGNLYHDLLSSQDNAHDFIANMGFDYEKLQRLGFERDENGTWVQRPLKDGATDAEKIVHKTNADDIHGDLVKAAGLLRRYFGGSAEISEAVMNSGGFPTYMFSNEPDREKKDRWNDPNISTDGDDGGAGGNYSGTGKLSSAAPKQVIVNISNLLSVSTIELFKSENGKQPEIQDLKEQMAQALIDVVHDFDASWHG